MKKKLLFVLLTALLVFINRVQAQVTVGINVTPPYSSKLSDYASIPGKVLITLTNTAVTGGNMKVYLRAQISGDNNNVKIATKPSYRPSQPIILQPGIPYIADMQTLITLFDANSFDIQGTSTSQIIKQDGLPEGSYQFCVRAYNYDLPALPVSSPNPFGCTTIRLTQLEPPLLVKPFDKDSISNRGIQNVVFSWNIPAGAEPATQYALRVIEMLDPRKNPTDAMNSKTTPAFYETVTAANIVVFGPAQPALVPGRKYAWAVTALPGIQGTSYKNNGRSEVRSFVYDPIPVKTTIVTLTSPADKEIIKPVHTTKSQPGYNVFKWDYPTIANKSIEKVVAVEINAGQTPEQAIKQNKNINTFSEPVKTTWLSLDSYVGKTLAWQVNIYDANGKVYSSDIHTFSVAAPKVTLLYPGDKDTMDVNTSVMMGATNGNVKWDFDQSFKVNGTPNQYVTIVEVNAGQTPQQAILNNPNFAGGKEPNKVAFFNFTNYLGKTLAWQVWVSDDSHNHETNYSAVQTFTIGKEDPVLVEMKNSIQEFTLNGFPVKVDQVANTHGFHYKGAGIVELYKGGPKFRISFNDITISPFGVTTTAKGKAFTDWRVTTDNNDPITFLDFYGNYGNYIPVKIAAEIEGNVTFNIVNVEFSPSIGCHWDAAKGYFIFDQSGSTDIAKLTGKLDWVSGIMFQDYTNKWQSAEFLSKQNETVSFSYKTRFYNSVSSELGFLNTNPNAIVKDYINAPQQLYNTSLQLSPILTVQPGNAVSTFDFSGSIAVAPPKEKTKGLLLHFAKKSNLNFDADIVPGLGAPAAWTDAINKDKSMSAMFLKTRINLTTNDNSTPYGISIPELMVFLNHKGNQYKFTYHDIPYDAVHGIALNKDKADDSQIQLMGFTVKVKTTAISMDKNQLLGFKIVGEMQIPVINQKARVGFFVSSEEVVGATVVFNTDNATTLYNNLSSGDKCTFKAIDGVLKDNEAVLDGAFSFSNTDGEKNLNVQNIQVAKLVIHPDGYISLKEIIDLPATVSQPVGTFNGFKITATKLGIEKYSNNQYGISVGGPMVLADNIGNSNFRTTVYFDGSEVTTGGASFSRKDFASFKEYHNYKRALDNKNLSFNTTTSASSDNERSSFASAGFTYFDNDPKYGTGFKATAGFNFKSPMDQNTSSQQAEATIWIGRKNATNYWYIEAGQKNIVVIPTPVLDVTINGFKGRIFYHMRHDGTNINDESYIPDANYLVGVYGQANLKTGTDNGMKFWGDFSMEIVTNTINGVEMTLFGNGNFITQGEGTPGLISAKDCTIKMSPSGMLGDFTVSYNTANLMAIDANAGFEIGNGNGFHVWGKGAGYLFNDKSLGSADCGFDLGTLQVTVFGNFKLAEIAKHYDFWICKPDVYINAYADVIGTLYYSPFQFKGGAKLHCSLKVNGCRARLSFGVDLDGQMTFPSPTCVSAGFSISTPLKDFSLDAGFKDGKIIFDKCFED